MHPCGYCITIRYDKFPNYIYIYDMHAHTPLTHILQICLKLAKYFIDIHILGNIQNQHIAKLNIWPIIHQKLHYSLTVCQSK